MARTTAPKEYGQNEADVMRKLLNESLEKQQAEDARIAKVAAWKPPTISWEDWWKANEIVRRNRKAQINAFMSPNLRAFAETLNK